MFPIINIKYCIWYYKKALDLKKKIELYYNEVKYNNKYNYYKVI